MGVRGGAPFNFAFHEGRPVCLQLTLDEKLLMTELDTGAMLYLLSHKTFLKLWSTIS